MILKVHSQAHTSYEEEVKYNKVICDNDDYIL